MKINIKLTALDKLRKACLIVGVFQDGSLTPTAAKINTESAHYLNKLIKQGSFQGKVGQHLHLFHLPNTTYEHVLLVGCGKSAALSVSIYRKIIESAMKALTTTGSEQAACYLTDLMLKSKSLAWRIKQITQIAHDAFYQFNLFKSEKQPVSTLNELILPLSQTSEQKECEIALNQGLAIASGVRFTKNLANLPSNICTPSFLADQAMALAGEHRSLTTKILSEKDMQKLKMGALLGVSQGSAEEAKLICIEYQGGSKKEAPIALVGKGITFDTGGNSLKPADSMVGMKYDMCGAASVFGTLKALALLNLPINVVGIIAAAENMPGGTAYKPEDILTSMSGQTIEVISTDAEGRLVLCDALTYCERYKPEVVIDIATLTGAVVIALGFHATGLLANDDKLANDLLTAGEEGADRAWQLPLWEEYQEQIKSPFADIANTGGRSAGTITAACFLSRFAKKFKWAHLDVAGTAAMMTGGTNARMATGRPVPLLMQYLINRAKKN